MWWIPVFYFQGLFYQFWQIQIWQICGLQIHTDVSGDNLRKRGGSLLF